MRPRIGSLFTGYGGLDIGARAALGGTVAWHCDIDPGSCRLLDHHWPDTPNLGDVAAVDWAHVEPVDVLTGGYPCQPFSHAGQRKGADDERHLWPHVREAIRRLRPRLTVLENVAGHRSLGFDRVLGDMAEDGLHARWVSVRASDVGAPHRRERLFIVAYPADADLPRWQGPQPAQLPDLPAGGGGPVALLSTPQARDFKGVPGDGFNAANLARDVSLLPTPEASDGTGGRVSAEVGGVRPSGAKRAVTLGTAVRHLLPTPAVNDMGAGKTVEMWDAWTDEMRAKHGNGNGHGPSLAIEALRLLPTPTSTDSKASGGGYNGQSNVTLTDATVRHADRWGRYAPAIARWEEIFRPAPPPTEPTDRGGRARLSPRFVEWLMGLPEGHVTGVPGLSYAAQLRLLGNGVVPAQAAYALGLLLRMGVAA